MVSEEKKEKNRLYYLDNKEVIIQREKERRSNGLRKYNPVTEKKQKLRSTYGLEWDSYLEMYNNQKGCCDICGKFLDLDSKMKTERPYVDHCHESGKVRSLLCQHCNSGLGHFKESPLSLLKAIQYLEKHNALR